MKAATYRAYGPPEVLRIEEMAQPAPKAGEVLVRVGASSVTSGDTRIRGFKEPGIFWLPLRLMLGLFAPRHPVAGMEFAGEIAAIGSAVTQFQVSEPVFGMTWLHGANAEYLTIPADALIATKPDRLTVDEAAAVPFGALSALVFLRDLGLVKSGQKVLVYGASGSVGVFAVQIAKYFGAEVTAVCSTANVDLVKSLGADHAIDYKVQDFTRQGKAYDLIFDTVGATSFSHCKRALTPQGRHLFLSGGLTQIVQAVWTSKRRGKRVVFGVPKNTTKDLLVIKGLIEDGTIRPVIDRTYALHDIVEAHRYVDTGRKKGSVIIAINGFAQPQR